jgi:hypothetical protein
MSEHPQMIGINIIVRVKLFSEHLFQRVSILMDRQVMDKLHDTKTSSSFFVVIANQTKFIAVQLFLSLQSSFFRQCLEPGSTRWSRFPLNVHDFSKNIRSSRESD